MVPCEVEEAHDWDSILSTTTTTHPNGTTTTETSISYSPDNPLSYQWTASRGSFSGPTNGRTAIWVAPTQPGHYFITCTIDDLEGARAISPFAGSRDDAALTNTCEVVVPTTEIRFKQQTLAIGAQNDDAHKAKFEIRVSDNGRPLAGITVAQPTVVAGTGRDPYQGTSARIEMESLVTDSNGIVKGKLQSGNRLETTEVRIQTDPGDAESGPSASAEQVWSDLGDNAWDYDEYFDYGEALTINYRMAYTRDGDEETITGHRMEPETTAITGYEWNPDAGEDWDEDGWPDGDYEEQTYSKDDVDTSDFDWWSGVVVSWGEVSEDDGTYSVDLFVEYRDDFELDSVEFNLADTNSYGAEGSLE